VKHPNFDPMHSISCFSPFVFDEFIAKGGENVHKADRTLLLTGRLREETCLRGRAYIESVRGSLFQGSFVFELFFAFSLVCHFSCHLLILRLFLLLDDLFELFFDFWSSSCASCGPGFEI
jgi:hypothetical protein